MFLSSVARAITTKQRKTIVPCFGTDKRDKLLGTKGINETLIVAALMIGLSS